MKVKAPMWLLYLQKYQEVLETLAELYINVSPHGTSHRGWEPIREQNKITDGNHDSNESNKV